MGFVEEARIASNRVYTGAHDKDRCYAIRVLRLKALHVKVASTLVPELGITGSAKGRVGGGKGNMGRGMGMG
jgi:hypothetical protein